MKTFKHKEFMSIGTPVNGADFDLFTSIVNQGIDSHLEGFVKSQFFFDCGRFYFHFHRDEKPILMRRLNSLIENEQDPERSEYLENWYNDLDNYDNLVKNYYFLTK